MCLWMWFFKNYRKIFAFLSTLLWVMIDRLFFVGIWSGWPCYYCSNTEQKIQIWKYHILQWRILAKGTIRINDNFNGNIKQIWFFCQLVWKIPLKWRDDQITIVSYMRWICSSLLILFSRSNSCVLYIFRLCFCWFDSI